MAKEMITRLIIMHCVEIVQRAICQGNQLEYINHTNQKGDALSRPLQFFVLYSFLIAANGESFMARIAGYKPDISATTTENASAPTAR